MSERGLARQPFLQHVYELRRRLTRVAGVFMLGSAAGYFWQKPLIELLQQPLGDTLYYTSPGGGFSFVTNVSIFAGALLAVPVIVYQLIKFIEPAFNHGKSSWSSLRFMIASVLLAACGFVFAYYIVLPSSLKFFAGFSTNNVEALISASDYLRFVTGCLVTFALVFQIPLILLLIDRHITPLPPQTLGKYRRHVIIASLLISLALPFTFDPITMGILAAPMILLYEVSILLIRLFGRKGAPVPARELPASELVVQSQPEPAKQVEPRILPQPNLLDDEPDPVIPDFHATPSFFDDEPLLEPVLDLRKTALSPSTISQPRRPQALPAGVIDLRQFSG